MSWPLEAFFFSVIWLCTLFTSFRFSSNWNFCFTSAPRKKPKPLAEYCLTYPGIFVGNEMGHCCFGVVCFRWFLLLLVVGLREYTHADTGSGPLNGTCQKSEHAKSFLGWKTTLGKGVNSVFLGFSRGNEYLYEKQCCIYWRGRPTHSESSSSTLSMSSGFPYTAHCFVKVVRKVTQTTKTGDEKDQPTEIATESALLRFFHQLTAQQMIDIDTAFHCQQKNCFIRMSNASNHHSEPSHCFTIIAPRDHPCLFEEDRFRWSFPCPFCFKKKMRLFLLVLWRGLETGNVPFKKSHLKMPNWIPTHQTSHAKPWPFTNLVNECSSHLARKASLGKIARKW